MAFQSCLYYKVHLCSLLRFLPPLYLRKNNFIPWKPIRTIKIYSNQYLSIFDHNVFQCNRVYHSKTDRMNVTNLAAKINLVHRQAIKDVKTALQPSDRFYVLKLLAKTAVLFLTVGVLNLLFYFQNIFPLTSKSIPFSMTFRNRNWTFSRETDLTFDDVVGCDDVKLEFENLIQVLLSPESVKQLGVRLPRSILLFGSSGVGKTYIVRAFAGKTGLPLIYINGNEFDGREDSLSIRQMFAAAHSKSPCIIFIDALDSLCARDVEGVEVIRASQTLNQLLVELDGFLKDTEKRRGFVLVIGAADRPDRLDPAILRSGRFDLKLFLKPPEKMDRLKLLLYYLRKVNYKPLSATEMKLFIHLTAGMTAADIANIINHAAILAGLENDERVMMQHLLKAIKRMTLGVERNLTGLDATRRKTIAIHEAGHAVVAFLTESAPDVFCVSLRHKLCGSDRECTCLIPDNSDQVFSKRQLLARIDVLLGGRIAEEILLGSGSVSDKSAEDLRHATFLAMKMVFQLGMSPRIGSYFLPMPEDGNDRTKHLSDSLKWLAEIEVNRLLRESHSRAHNRIYSHRKQLRRVVEALEEYEVLDAEDLALVMKGGSPKAAMAKEAEVERTISSWSNF